jgi:sugar lactone lactonase YvrE
VKISRIEACRCQLGEGPVWDPDGQALYVLDIQAQKIVRFTPADGSLTSWETPMRPGAMAMREGGGAVVAMQNRVAALDLDTGAFTPIATAATQAFGAIFNDGKVDRQGRFVIGSCCSGIENPRPIGGIFSLDANHHFALIEKGITFSNGPCFSPDGRTFYFSDSAEYACYAYDYDGATGAISNKRLFVETRPHGGMPDGATVDADGLVWMAIFRGGKIVAFRPDGKVERVVDMPVSLTVSTMFGGPNLDQLYVTTIDPTAFGEAAEEGAGYLYVVEGLGARGLPEPRYAG